VKNYVNEPGSGRLQELFISSDAVGTCVLGLVEVVSAFCRHEREGRITRKDYRTTKAHLAMDMADMDVVQFTGAVVERAIRLLEGSDLKASDALHIAAAVEWQADRFVSADKKQLEAARGVGLHCIAVQ